MGGIQIMINKFINKIILGDAMEVLDKIPDKTVDIVLTDPPYFLDKMDNNWDEKNVSKTGDYAVKSLPPGMKFDREQGVKLYEWFYEVSKKLKRILKPGGFFFSFSSPRLYHRLASAVDDAGFLLRDSFIWLYTQNQPKAMSLNHFIDKMEVDNAIKEKLKEDLNGWKTPQIKSCYEPIIVAQKDYDKTFLNNIRKHKVGLFNTKVEIGNNMFPSNVLIVEGINPILDKYFLVSKPDFEEKREYNTHKTVKPITICEYLIKLSVFSDDAVILDPFIGSGTTAIAAKRLGFNFIGIDINKEYVGIANKRLEEIDDGEIKDKEGITKQTSFLK